MKKIFNRKLILRLEMLVLIIIALVAVTIAWFVLVKWAKVESLSVKAKENEFIKVALKPGGADVQTLQGQEKYVDIQMPDFYDMPEGMMAPGAYGKVTLYITSLSPLADSCYIYLERIPELLSSIPQGSTREKEINNLLKGHLLFYKEYTETDGYKGMITKEAPLYVKLEEKKEVAVTIYWMWPYEYTDIPVENRNLDKEALFDMDKYEEQNASKYTEDDFVSFYDYGDTKIGLSVKNIHFYAYVSALKEDETR